MNPDLKKWVRALRAYSFSATVIPVTVAFLFARAQGLAVAWPLFPLMLFCALLLHAGVNLLNDYYDFTLGFDTAEACGSSGLLTEGVVHPAYMLKWGRFYIFAGAAAGLLLAAIRGWPLLIAGLTGTAGAWFYSHRAGYKYKGLGEPFVFILMGPLLFDGAFYAATGTLTVGAAWPALACGCLVTAILLVNNLRDIRMDQQAGFITLPMRLGTSRTKKLYAVLIAGSYAAMIVPVASGTVHAGMLLPLLSLPVAWRQIRQVLAAAQLNIDLADAPPQTAALYLIFGGLLAAGLALPF
ncbi:MAG: 1,4-dihydroxy-2-naphthoate octaprenyltransferase [Kiritimatiellales bacterium]|nr:1,4-dihydroxy-2-naphthoate octaprenyltransferase [Kiritimatiellales bacterium]